jgi:hypothetical protein
LLLFKALHNLEIVSPAESGELARVFLEKEEWQNLQLFLVFRSHQSNSIPKWKKDNLSQSHNEA